MYSPAGKTTALATKPLQRPVGFKTRIKIANLHFRPVFEIRRLNFVDGNGILRLYLLITL